MVTRVCVSVCLSVRARMPTLLDGPGCNLGNGSGPLVVHCWADLQSVHEFHCYDDIAPCVFAVGAHDSIAANAKCQRVHACTRSMPGCDCERSFLLSINLCKLGFHRTNCNDIIFEADTLIGNILVIFWLWLAIFCCCF